MERISECLLEPFCSDRDMFRVDDRIDLQLAGTDHLDVDVGVGKLLEQHGCHVGVAAQANAADRDLGDLAGAVNIAHLVLLSDLFGHLKALEQVVGAHGKADARRAVFTVITLNDHVDEDTGGADRLEHVGSDSRSIGNPVQRDSGLVLRHRDAGQREGLQRVISQSADQDVHVGPLASFRLDLVPILRVGWLLVQVEGLVHRTQRHVGLGSGNRGGNLDFAGRDHLNVDVRVGQGTKHSGGNIGLRGHIQSDHRHLGDLVVMGDPIGADLRP